MTTNHHTPISNGAPANSSTVNAPLSELDSKITDHETRVSALESEFPVASGNPTEFLNGDGEWVVPAGTGASIDGHVIKDEGVALPQRASIDFVGAGVSVTNEAGGTQVSIPGGGHTIEDEGTPVTQRATINFTGAGVTVTDNSGKTKVDIPGGVTDHGALSGLSDDDHTQYHNDSRGDARYPRKYAGKTTAPTVNDDTGDGYVVGDRWLDETNDKEYVALDVTLGAAVWKETTSTGGGLTLSIASVTTSNVTGVEGTHHVLNVAGLTANRDFNLPTPSAAGKTCKVTISTGDDTYALVIKKNSTEITRLFITEETLEFVSTGTNPGDWVLVQNGKRACYAVIERSTAQAIPNATATKCQLNNSVINVGDMQDVVTNFRINIRRSGNYKIVGRYAAVNLDDQESALAYIYVDGASVSFDRLWMSSATTNQIVIPKPMHEIALNAGQTVELYLFHNEGASVDTDTTSRPRLTVEEKL